MAVLRQLDDSALVNEDQPIRIEGGRPDDEGGIGVTGTLPTSFVPNRNALLLTIASDCGGG